MGNFQRGEAIDMLAGLTEFTPEELEEYTDFQLEVWLNELGYAWNPKGGYGMGAWKLVED